MGVISWCSDENHKSIEPKCGINKRKCKTNPNLIPLIVTANTLKHDRQVDFQGTNGLQHQNFGKGVQALVALL